MHELVALAIVVGSAMVVIAFGLRLIGPAVRVVEKILLLGSVAVILGVMVFVCAEVVMRYAFNAPIPGHLEGSELLVPVIVFLALSFTQATHGHVGMELLIDNIPATAQRWLNIITLIASIFICAVIAWFSFKHSYQLWEYDDVTMTPPYFKTWPAAATIVLGYGLCAVRMYIQLLHLIAPATVPAYEPELPNPEHVMTGSE